MSLQFRLSLFYSSVLALTLIVFGSILYFTQSQYTMNWLKQDLIISSQTLSQSILQKYLKPAPPTNEPPSPDRPPPELSFSNDQTFIQQSESEIVRVLDPDGNLVASPFGDDTGKLPISPEGIQAVREGRDWWETQNISGNRLLVYNHPVYLNNRVLHILQVGRSLKERDQSLQSLGSTLVIAILIATLVAFALGLVLSRITLQPIRQISQTAKEIGSKRDFTRRVVYSGPPDEIGQLATTFNGMLAQLEEAYQKLAHSLEMQRDFVADVSHELRTPLTTLRGNLGLLMRRPALPTEEQVDILNDMVDESDRLIRLVNDLLVMARANTRRNLTKQPMAIYPIMEEVCRQVHQLDPTRQIKLDEPKSIIISADRDAFKQVLLILVDNALKHSKGDISITADADETQVIIGVQNFGEGISAEQLEHVFDRFYRADENRRNQGSGLGLPIAKELVEAQGGNITMQSEKGKGSIILLSFPIPE